MTIWLAAITGLVLAGCATGDGLDEVAPPPASEVLAVRVSGDGFVRTAGRRIPLEAFVLEMRQHTRAIGAHASLGVRIDIEVDDDGGDPAVRAADFLIEQMQIMGVRQIRFL